MFNKKDNHAKGLWMLSRAGQSKPQNLFTPLYQLINSDSPLHSIEELKICACLHCNCLAKANSFPLIEEFKHQDAKERKYLPFAKRTKLLVTAENGSFKDKDGDVLDGEYIFVMLPNHKLYAAPRNKVANHSHLSAGLPVLSAGFLYFYRGLLVTISNNSGHYKPSLLKMLHALNILGKLGQTDFFVEDHTKYKEGLKYYSAKALCENQLAPIDISEVANQINQTTKNHAQRLFDQQMDEIGQPEFDEDDALEALGYCYETIIPNEGIPDEAWRVRLIEQYTGFKRKRSSSRFGASPSILPKKIHD